MLNSTRPHAITYTEATNNLLGSLASTCRDDDEKMPFIT